MPALVHWDPRPAIPKWLEIKHHRDKKCLKSKQKKCLKGIFTDSDVKLQAYQKVWGQRKRNNVVFEDGLQYILDSVYYYSLARYTF